MYFKLYFKLQDYFFPDLDKIIQHNYRSTVHIRFFHCHQSKRYRIFKTQSISIYLNDALFDALTMLIFLLMLKVSSYLQDTPEFLSLRNQEKTIREFAILDLSSLSLNYQFGICIFHIIYLCTISNKIFTIFLKTFKNKF